MKSMASNGFTLIEVLIAMAIIGIGLITLLTLFPIGLRSSRLAGDFTTASFIGQQALDSIRASAQVYDPGDGFFDNTYDPNPNILGPHLFPSTNRNGLGYYELPISAVKGYLSPLRFPVDPYRSQTWTIEFTSATAYTVTGSASGLQGPGNVGTVFTATSNEISFIVYDNKTGVEWGASPGGPYESTHDIEYPLAVGGPQQEYDDFMDGDQLVINVEMRAGVPYYWYAMRAPVTEDQDLDGILDGRLPDPAPNGTPRPAPHNIVNEDTGLDLVPDFWDTNNDGAYQAGLDRRGEFSSESGRADYPTDPHGDNRYAYDPLTGWWDTTTLSNRSGSEGNGQIDAYPDDYIQKVTVIVGWREGSQDRTATFSASIANQFR